jgi:CRISPR/Cas system CMR subunit Cmr4 (Cas7 group RAMP superfamily)
MALEKKIVGVVAHISCSASGDVTHAWQDTLYAVLEDGVEKNRYVESNQNLDPDRIVSVLPEQGKLAAQLVEAKNAAAEAAQEASGKISKLSAENDEFKGKYEALVSTLAKIHDGLGQAVSAHSPAVTE